MELAYGQALDGVNNTSSYNGNISGITWSTYDHEDTQVNTRGYRFEYDASDRMTAAALSQKTAAWTATNAFGIDNISYDSNGNIQSLNRKDETASNIDLLNYTYQGNQLVQVADAANEMGFNDENTSGDDYAYDVNGNLIKDLNKNIASIRYNYLNLPLTIVLNDPEPEAADSLTYEYTAEGTKLKMMVWKDGNILSDVDYVGAMRYENGVLQSLAHSEGRIVFKEDTDAGLLDADYQYFLTDHQGNTRRILSTLPESYTTVESFEGNAQANNETGFTDLHLHTQAVANTTPGGNGVSLLQSGQTGALVLLQVDKGDTITLSVQANYESAPDGSTFVSAAYNALFSQWNQAFGSATDAAGISGSETVFDQALSGADMAGKGTNPSAAPKAYLNYILFDKEMNYKSAGFQQISTAAQGVGVHEELRIPTITGHSGYLLAYLSNENSEAVNIHFDDFTVVHAKTNVIQALDYYPFGMEAISYTRTAADPTQYLYNGGVERNEITSYYETFYRTYDASIGRFHQVDPLAGHASSMTPYNYAYNDPVYYNDPMGDCSVCGSFGPPGLSTIDRMNSSYGGYYSDGYEDYIASSNFYAPLSMEAVGSQAAWDAVDVMRGNLSLDAYGATYGESLTGRWVDPQSTVTFGAGGVQDAVVTASESYYVLEQTNGGVTLAGIPFDTYNDGYNQGIRARFGFNVDGADKYSAFNIIQTVTTNHPDHVKGKSPYIDGNAPPFYFTAGEARSFQIAAQGAGYDFIFDDRPTRYYSTTQEGQVNWMAEMSLMGLNQGENWERLGTWSYGFSLRQGNQGNVIIPYSPILMNRWTPIHSKYIRNANGR